MYAFRSNFFAGRIAASEAGVESLEEIPALRTVSGTVLREADMAEWGRFWPAVLVVDVVADAASCCARRALALRRASSCI